MPHLSSALLKGVVVVGGGCHTCHLHFFIQRPNQLLLKQQDIVVETRVIMSHNSCLQNTELR